MLRLISATDPSGLFILILAALSAIVLGFSAIHYICFSTGKDEINFEDDDSIYAFYGGKRHGKKKVTFVT